MIGKWCFSPVSARFRTLYHQNSSFLNVSEVCYFLRIISDHSVFCFQSKSRLVKTNIILDLFFITGGVPRYLQLYSNSLVSLQTGPCWNHLSSWRTPNGRSPDSSWRCAEWILSESEVRAHRCWRKMERRRADNRAPQAKKMEITSPKPQTHSFWTLLFALNSQSQPPPLKP